jgi:F-type H+-transporting ATPase subunit a
MFKISLGSQKVVYLANIYLTNTILSTWLAMGITISLAALAAWGLKKKRNNFLVAGSRLLVRSFYNFINGILENKELSWQVLPLITALFVYITTANWLGLIPGLTDSLTIKTTQGLIPLFKAANADINSTAGMAIVSIFLIKILSAHFPEAKNYLKVGVNKVFQTVLISFEKLSEVTRVVSLSFRLMGNVFAGEILLLIIAAFAPYFVPVPFMFLEFFVGLFQALVFSVLILVFVKW